MLIFFSFYLFHAPVTPLNLFGYAFCCTGVAVYNWQKLQARAACGARRGHRLASRGGRGGGGAGWQQLAEGLGLGL